MTLQGHSWEEDGDAGLHCPPGDVNEQMNTGKGVDGRRRGGWKRWSDNTLGDGSRNCGQRHRLGAEWPKGFKKNQQGFVYILFLVLILL